jgi:hypothetical protein
MKLFPELTCRFGHDHSSNRDRVIRENVLIMEDTSRLQFFEGIAIETCHMRRKEQLIEQS